MKKVLLGVTVLTLSLGAFSVQSTPAQGAGGVYLMCGAGESIQYDGYHAGECLKIGPGNVYIYSAAWETDGASCEMVGGDRCLYFQNDPRGAM